MPLCFVNIYNLHIFPLNQENVRSKEMKSFLYSDKKMEGYHMTQKFQLRGIVPREQET